MFPFYIFAVLSIVYVTMSSNIAAMSQALVRNPATTMAQTVLAAHSSAVRVTADMIDGMDHVAGSSTDVDTRYWNNSLIRSSAFVAAPIGGFPAGEFVVTWLPAEAGAPDQISRVAGYVRSAATTEDSSAGVFDASAPELYGNGYAIPHEIGITDGAVFVITDMAGK